MGGEPRKDAAARPFLGRGGGGGDEDGDVFAGGSGGGGDDDPGRGDDDWEESGTAAAARSFGGSSGGSMFSSWSSLTDDDDDVTSTLQGGRRWPSSSSSEGSMQLDGGPLYEMSELLDDLPVKTGLSIFYKGMSRSFTSLSDAKCAEQLEKKENPYNTRMKKKRRYAAAATATATATARRGSSRPSDSLHGPSKAIAKRKPRREKKMAPRGSSSDAMLSRGEQQTTCVVVPEQGRRLQLQVLAAGRMG